MKIQLKKQQFNNTNKNGKKHKWLELKFWA